MKPPKGEKGPPAAPDATENRQGILHPPPRYVPRPQADGSADGFREEMIAFLPRLSRFAYSLTGNMDQRDDLVQETCARALAHGDQWQPGTRLDSWMFRIAQNIWFDRKRAEKSRGGSVDIHAVDDLVGCDGRAVTQSRLDLAEVLRGLDRLSPQHRVLIALVCVEGLTYREAADVLDIPVGTVMSRLSRARLALHDAVYGGSASKATTTLESGRGRNVR